MPTRDEPDLIANAPRPPHPARRMRGRPRGDDGAAIERELLDVALRLFVEHGYGATSMTAIARAAHVSKTTLYARFPSKEGLFVAIIRTQIAQVADLAGLDVPGEAPDLAAGLRRFAMRMLAVSLQDDLLEIDWLILSEARRFPELGAAATERTRAGVAQLADYIRERAAADGVPCRDAEAVAEVFLQMIRGWFLNTMLAGRKAPMAEQDAWAARAVALLMAGRAQW